MKLKRKLSCADAAGCPATPVARCSLATLTSLRPCQCHSSRACSNSLTERSTRLPYLQYETKLISIASSWKLSRGWDTVEYRCPPETPSSVCTDRDLTHKCHRQVRDAGIDDCRQVANLASCHHQLCFDSYRSRLRLLDSRDRLLMIRWWQIFPSSLKPASDDRASGSERRLLVR